MAIMSGLLLPTPTVELVRARCNEFDKEPSTRLAEDALRQLWARFPRNTETSHVLLKALALNKLYSTRVRDIDVETLARHIAALGIDPLLDEGSPRTVALITQCNNLRNYYSFATKYCSWHNPDAYPIYDTRVDECLWSYKKQDGHQDGYPKFHRQDLFEYPTLREVVTQFRNFYKLGSFNFKAIDKFLWLQGESLFSPT
jgi:hypothetical protein